MRSSSATIIEASSMSRCSSASRVRSRASTTMSSAPRADFSSSWSCSEKCLRAASGIELPDPSGHVRLGSLVAWVLEDGLGPVVLDDLAVAVLLALVEDNRQERGHVGNARGLLHVVRDD